MDPTLPGPNHVLNMHRMPIKIEYPSTSEYLLVDEFRQSLSAASKKSRGRPKIDFHQKPIKLEKEIKSGIVKVGRRRGRPSKTKGYNPGQLSCNACHFKTEDFYELEMHIKTHADQNMYDCPYCGSTFSQKGNLMTHIRTHTKEKPFKCLICDFAASQKVNLQVHIRTHTKEKPFKCSVCDFSTAQKCNLIAHRTRRHSNVEIVKTLDTYECPVGNPDNQLKYYRCGMCMFSCRLKREMVDHIKIQHSFTNCEYQTIDVLKKSDSIKNIIRQNV
ncbi:zinc finger protein, putative [Pediculus humanus corporis]|uniref:Zinc finger protein, putative n=1 Tax=Pediculus humanus subsp. corporis TaxID=121224 RepID=E0VTV7_PEDHC|nr:zinc finger protein, putative [Pediculus humanus corporis]EEB16813.1 zinc finger protein, putative [Pediculus humanus corporis]